MTQSQHGAAVSTAVAQRGAPVKPAELVITVSDDKRPLANSTRRGAARIDTMAEPGDAVSTT